VGSLGPIHWIIVGAVVLLVFGGKIKLSAVMGDAAQGLRAFREGLKNEPAAPGEPQHAPAIAAPNEEPTVR
jgi:sec-independent protein translocase protein TatA